MSDHTATEKGHVSRTDEPAVVTKRKPGILNPLRCVRILFLKDAAPIALVHGFNYMIDYSVQTSIPPAFKDIYGFNELEIGLSYLPRGLGIMIDSYANERLMDWNYKITAKQIEHVIDKDHDNDINHFPIERARTRKSYYLLSIMTCSVIGYGWALEKHSQMGVVLAIQFIQDLLGASIYTYSNTLLVDILPDTPSMAATAASIVRCALAAVGTATVQPLIGVLGRGWYFTLLGSFAGTASLIATWIVRAWGMQLRASRTAKTSS